VPNCFQHAAHLPVPALPYDQPDPGQPSRAPYQLGVGRKRPTVFKLDTLAQRAQIPFTGYSLHDRQILFGHVVTRMCESVGQLTVVRQQEQAARGAIQPTNCEKTGRPGFSDQVEDGGPSLRIARRHQHTGWLVQRKVLVQPEWLDRLAVDRDTVRAGVDHQAGCWRHAAVDAHRSRGDEHVGGAP
jgi:hypothetical protein